jgi:hypothetical protein
MAIDPIFERVFKKLYDMPCWGVKNCVGSDIVFEFGKPHLEIREPRTASPKTSRRVRELFARRLVVVHGEWHLWIDLCHWEIFQKGKRIGSDQTRSDLQRLVDSLSGQKLVRFSIRSRGDDCVFEFDLGGVLVTHASGTDYNQWMLFEPSGFVLTLRGDKRFSYHPSNKPSGAGSWKPMYLRTQS